MEKDKSKNNDLQNIAQKTKDLTIRTKLYIGVNAGGPEGLAIPAPQLQLPVVDYAKNNASYNRLFFKIRKQHLFCSFGIHIHVYRGRE